MKKQKGKEERQRENIKRCQLVECVNSISLKITFPFDGKAAESSSFQNIVFHVP